MTRSTLNLVGTSVSAENVGGGAGIFKDKNTGNNLRFKSLVAGTGVQLIQSGETITISASTGGGSTSPAGANTQIQYNDTGSFGASSNFTWNNNNRVLNINGSISISGTSFFGAGSDITSIRIGCDSVNSGTYGVAIGNGSYVNGSGIAMGNFSYACNSYSIGFGGNANAANDCSIAIGYSSYVTADGGIAVGRNSLTTTTNSIALGNVARVYGDISVAVGGQAYTNGYGALSVGFGSCAEGAQGVANGVFSRSFNNGGISIGGSSRACAVNAIGIGYFAIGNVTSSIALGNNVENNTECSVAFGWSGEPSILLAKDGTSYINGNDNTKLGLNTTGATARLHIVSTGITEGFRLVDGNQQAGYVLTSDSDGNASWQQSSGGTGSTTPPAGANRQIQFNDNGSFGADENFYFNSATNSLALATTNNVLSGSCSIIFGGNNNTFSGGTSNNILIGTNNSTIRNNAFSNILLGGGNRTIGFNSGVASPALNISLNTSIYSDSTEQIYGRQNIVGGFTEVCGDDNIAIGYGDSCGKANIIGGPSFQGNCNIGVGDKYFGIYGNNNVFAVGEYSILSGSRNLAIGDCLTIGDAFGACGGYGNITVGYNIDFGGQVCNSFALGDNHRIDNGSCRSAIIGGYDARISGGTATNLILLGLDEPRAFGNDWTNHTIVSNLAIYSTPSNGTGSDEVLVWDSGDYKVKKVTQASISDCRLKTNIAYLSNVDLSSLNAVSFEYNNKVSQAGECSYGLIAQDVEKVFPYAVKNNYRLENDDNVYKTVDYKQLVPVLVEKIKELENRINLLENN